MSNPERQPTEVTCASAPQGAGPTVLDFRAVPLGGPRAMTVRRTLPQRSRSLIGAWCFIDHYGPDDVAATGGMVVPGHPHTGLQTVSWLFSGEVEHLDTTGVHALVRPGELNLMTAGAGIAHSEYSTPDTATLHGAQLWVALPDEHRGVAPGFEHYAPPVVEVDGVRVLVFLGSVCGQTSPVATWSPLVGAELTIPAGGSISIDADATFEHGILCDTGLPAVDGHEVRPGQLAYVPSGASSLRLSGGSAESRVLLLGGEPLGEQIVMWWNFIGRSHDEIVAFRETWQRERLEASDDDRLFGELPAEWSETLPAPVLPNLRLRPRG